MLPTQPALQQTPAWLNLVQHAEHFRSRHVSDILFADPERLNAYELAVDGLKLNFGLARVDAGTLDLLMRLAEARDIDGWRCLMLSGALVNQSEKRAALHMALRQKKPDSIVAGGHNIAHDILRLRESMAEFVNAIRKGKWLGASGKPIRHVVNIGIGGSDLGPRLVAGALAPVMQDSIPLHVHFVANADAADLMSKLGMLNAEETLFVVVSKTFSTQETLLNARTARAWIVDALGEKAVKRHFFAVSTNTEAIKEFGIDPKCTLPMWDWVGGRFSLWSGVGISAALALGMDTFNQLLAGAAAMDEHFRHAPLPHNMPVILAMLGIWNASVLGTRAHAVLPYAERLRDLPRYLQQLEMESNGKTALRDGTLSAVPTTPVLFGEPGTVGQHSFHQWLHQSTDFVSADFIGIMHDDWAKPEHHRVMLANMLAQAGALAFGQRDGVDANATYPGDRSCNLILLDRLDAYHLGMLLALYEHKVFVQSIIWGLNPFDQPGVELGKVMANKILGAEAASTIPTSMMANLYKRITQ